MPFDIIVAALIGGAVSAVLVTWYGQWAKGARLRSLKSAASAVEFAARPASDSEAKEAEKLAIDEKYAIKALQDAVAKL